MSTPVSGLPAGFPAGPRTPEPTATTFALAGHDARPPSPPRPRLRLKRRVVSHLSAPTQNFLASVAAADVPIPSIEVPEPDSDFAGPLSLQLPSLPQQLQLPQTLLSPLGGETDSNNLLRVRGRSAFSPPKTPAPDALPSSTSPSRYPDWSIDSVFSSSAESSPDPECGSSSRPSTARSTQTSSSSLFSRFSQLSDDEAFASPEDELAGHTKASVGHSAYTNNELRRNPASGGPPAGPTVPAVPSLSADAASIAASRGNGQAWAPSSRRRSARKAAWTKAMSAHLWATYILYLQDPKVTPFRVGKSCVPPHGVLLRVAREAKRSWKGSRALAKAAAVAAAPMQSVSPGPVAAPSGSGPDSAPEAASAAGEPAAAGVSAAGTKSGSSTPTAADSGVSGTFMEWPFTNAATRAHLRELCRLKAATPGGGARGLQYMSRSPTPFTHATAAAAAAVSAAATRPRDLRLVTPGLGGAGAARSTAAVPRSTFAHDMALSLALSTSEAMQPHGPLAQLTRSAATMSADDDATSASSAASTTTATTSTTTTTATTATTATATTATHDFASRLSSAMEADEPSFAERRRLGSPFTARSYGPSSSSSLAAVLGLSSSAAAAANARQPHTVGPRRSLQSPVRLSRSGTQKRRTKHLSQDLRRRPGLASDFFTEPSAGGSGRPAFWGGGDDFGSSAMDTTHPEEGRRLFMPRRGTMPSLTSSSSAPQLTLSMGADLGAATAVDELSADHYAPEPAPPSAAAAAAAAAATAATTTTPTVSRLLDAAPLQPAVRLGSPFSSLAGGGGSTTSFSFPNRFSQPTDFEAAPLARPFATVQRIVQPKAVPARANLASRLAYIDQRLRELNSRSEAQRRQSDSPL